MMVIISLRYLREESHNKIALKYEYIIEPNGTLLT